MLTYLQRYKYIHDKCSLSVYQFSFQSLCRVLRKLVPNYIDFFGLVDGADG